MWWEDTHLFQLRIRVASVIAAVPGQDGNTGAVAEWAAFAWFFFWSSWQGFCDVQKEGDISWKPEILVNNLLYPHVLKGLFIFMCVGILQACLYAHYMCALSLKKPERDSEVLELEFQMTLSHHLGAEDPNARTPNALGWAIYSFPSPTCSSQAFSVSPAPIHTPISCTSSLNPSACENKILHCTRNKSKMAFIVFYQSRVTLSQQGFLFFKLGLLLIVLLDSKHVNGC